MRDSNALTGDEADGCDRNSRICHASVTPMLVFLTPHPAEDQRDVYRTTAICRHDTSCFTARGSGDLKFLYRESEKALSNDTTLVVAGSSDRRARETEPPVGCGAQQIL